MMQVGSNELNVKKEGLSLEQTLWANTIIASTNATGIVIYTGVFTLPCILVDSFEEESAGLDSSVEDSSVYCKSIFVLYPPVTLNYSVVATKQCHLDGLLDPNTEILAPLG